MTRAEFLANSEAAMRRMLEDSLRSSESSMLVSGCFDTDEIDEWLSDMRRQSERDLDEFVVHRLPEIWENALAGRTE